ncbi:MAG: metal-dependent transcriptional regulator [Clostridia bacterium]|nr:metal-dependent transcriptional regulator [Clostridia bacterium]
MTMQESGQMYLETILVLSKKLERVRSVDIAEHMGYSKPSVSRAVGLLRRDGYIEVDGLGSVTLTESGLKVAETIYERHRILSAVLEALGVSHETAVDDACKLEHYISEESFEAVKRYIRGHSGCGND